MREELETTRREKRRATLRVAVWHLERAAQDGERREELSGDWRELSGIWREQKLERRIRLEDTLDSLAKKEY